MNRPIKIALVSLAGLLLGIVGDLWLLMRGSAVMAGAVHANWVIACLGGLLVAQGCGLIGMVAISVGWVLGIVGPKLDLKPRIKRVIRRRD